MNSNVDSSQDFLALKCCVVPFHTEGGPAHPQKGPPKKGMRATAVGNAGIFFTQGPWAWWRNRQSYGTFSTYWQKAYLRDSEAEEGFMAGCLQPDGRSVYRNDHQLIQIQRLKDYVGKSSVCQKWRIVTTIEPWWCIATSEDEQQIKNDYKILRERIIPELESMQASHDDLVKMLCSVCAFAWIAQSNESHLQNMVKVQESLSIKDLLRQQLEEGKQMQQELEQAQKELTTEKAQELLDLSTNDDQLLNEAQKELARRVQELESRNAALQEELERSREETNVSALTNSTTDAPVLPPPPPGPPPPPTEMKIITAEMLRGQRRIDPDSAGKSSAKKDVPKPAIFSVEELLERAKNLKKAPTNSRDTEAKPDVSALFASIEAAMLKRRKSMDSIE